MNIKRNAVQLLLIFVLMNLFGLIGVFAQQPQTSTAPIQPENVKYLQGVGTGYWPTAGSGLTLNLAAGTAICAGTPQGYAGGTLALTDNTTNNIYLNVSANCAPATKTSAFLVSDIPLAVVVTSGGSITTITDDRTMFISPLAASSINAVGPICNVLGSVCNGVTTTAAYGKSRCISSQSPMSSQSCTNIAVTTAGGNTTVTCAADCFTTADNGLIAWMFRTASNGGGTDIAETRTITFIDTKHISLSGANLSASAAQNVLIIGKDDGPALASVATAIGSTGGSVYVPAGNYMVGSTPFTFTGSVHLFGDNYNTTRVWFSQGFPYSAVGFLATFQAGTFDEMTFDGLGNAPSCSSKIAIQVNGALVSRNVQVRNWAPSTGGVCESFHVTANNTVFDHLMGSGTTNDFFVWQGSYNTVLNPAILGCINWCVYNTGGGGSYNDVIGGQMLSATGPAYLAGESAAAFGKVIGVNLQGPTGGQINFTGSVIDFIGDTFGPTPAVTLSNMTSLVNISGGTMRVVNSNLYSDGTGFIFNNPSGGVVIDNGANTFRKTNTGGLITGTGNLLLSSHTLDWPVPVITGTGACGTIGSQTPSTTGNSTAGTYACTGTSGAATVTFTWTATAPTAWSCATVLPHDQTTPADVFTWTSSSATACVYGATAIVQNDVIAWGPIGQF